MTNYFERNPVYLTAQDVKDMTSKDDLKTLDDEDVNLLIVKSEDLVDGYIIRYGQKCDSEQLLIFPITENDVCVIPTDIRKATLYTVEQVYLNGDLITGSTTTKSGGEIKSEKTGDRTITYTEGSENITSNSLKFLGLPPEAIAILNKYRKLFYRTKI